MLTQHEKIVMFGLVDNQLRDSVNEIKAMIGFDKPHRRKKTKDAEKLKMKKVVQQSNKSPAHNPSQSKGSTSKNAGMATSKDFTMKVKMMSPTKE